MERSSHETMREIVDIAYSLHDIAIDYEYQGIEPFGITIDNEGSYAYFKIRSRLPDKEDDEMRVLVAELNGEMYVANDDRFYSTSNPRGDHDLFDPLLSKFKSFAEDEKINYQNSIRNTQLEHYLVEEPKNNLKRQRSTCLTGRV